MLNDFTLIHSKFEGVSHLNLYPLGDVHIGSAEFNLELFEEWSKTVQDDPYGVVCIVGDMMNMGLKNSKTNVYEESLSPMEQKEFCYRLLQPLRNRIIAGCSGNHENRVMREVGTNPLYDVFCRLGIENRYRENACFIKLQVGKVGKNPNVYGVVLTHGRSKTRDAQWNYSVDGCDCFISGHTHLGTHQPCGKIKMDLIHNTVKTTGYQHIVVCPFLQYGGYAIDGKYLPNHFSQFQRITFDGSSKRVGYHYS